MKSLVSIVVPVYNAASIISSCIESLLNLDYPKDSLEILVVDNNSLDATANIIKRYPVRYILEEKKGPAAARNRGIKESKGEFIAFTDADCVVDKEWLNNLMSGFDRDKIVGCAGELFVYPSDNAWLGKESVDLCAQNGPINQWNFLAEYKALPCASGCNVVYRKKVLDEMNLFDESFMWGEDLDMSWRVILSGHQLKYIPEAIVYHRFRESLYKFFLQVFRLRYSMICRFKKYPWIDKKYKSKYHLINVYQLFRSVITFVSGIVSRRKRKGKRRLLFLKMVESFAVLCGDIYWDIRLIGKQIKPFSLDGNRVFWWFADKDVAISKYENDDFKRYQLEGVSARIWELLHEGESKDNVVDTIADEFEVDRERITGDFDKFIENLEKESLLV